jgi:hypothetical protein
VLCHARSANLNSDEAAELAVEVAEIAAFEDSIVGTAFS